MSKTLKGLFASWMAISSLCFAADLETEDSFFKKDVPQPKPAASAAAKVTPKPGPPATAIAPEPPPKPAAKALPVDANPVELEPVDQAEEPIPIDSPMVETVNPKPQEEIRQLPIPDFKNYTNKPKFIEHPLSEKGLIKIDKERVYIYDVQGSPQTRGTSVRFGVFDPTFLKNPETNVHFKDIYSNGDIPMIMVDYEWLLWRSLGKMYFTAGSGVFAGSGHGQFENETYFTPKENFTFMVFPCNLGVTWRLQFTERQIFVPYAVGGGTLFAFAEIRDDDKPPRFGGSPAAYGGGGLQINMNFMETKSMFDLDRDYGINTIWFTAEYRRVQTLSQRFDFSSNVINAGFLIEF